MLDEIDWEDLIYIFNLNGAQDNDGSIASTLTRAAEVYDQRVSFFQRFEDSRAFFISLISPIRFSLLFTMGAAYAACNVIFASLALTIHAILILGAALGKNIDLRDEAMQNAMDASYSLGVNFIGVMVGAFLAVLSVPINVTAFFTDVLAPAKEALDDYYEASCKP